MRRIIAATRGVSILFWASIVACAPSPVIADEGANPYWRVGDILIEQGWARVVSGGLRSGAVYLTVHNLSSTPDVLVGVDSPASKLTTIHDNQRLGSEITMYPVSGGVLLPGHGEVVMRPGKIHIMLAGVSEAVKAGGNLPVRMTFRDAGILNLVVPVVPILLNDPETVHMAHAK